MSQRAQRTAAPSGSLSVPVGAKPSATAGLGDAWQRPSGEVSRAGLLIVNADDWGRDRETTDRTSECVAGGAVSSVSGMVFMQDSERAAAIARERGIDVGLHLNFTTPFSAQNGTAGLLERQRELAAYLLRHRLAPAVFNPWLARSFEYVLEAQLEEYRRLYGAELERLDGHHHMHLCANVLFGKLLPAGTIVRRNFTFRPGEKSWVNRTYRKIIDRALARRHRIVDVFVVLRPLEPLDRLEWIFSQARKFVVELETHAVNPAEYGFLARGEIFRWARDLPIADRFALTATGHHQPL